MGWNLAFWVTVCLLWCWRRRQLLLSFSRALLYATTGHMLHHSSLQAASLFLWQPRSNAHLKPEKVWSICQTLSHRSLTVPLLEWRDVSPHFSHMSHETQLEYQWVRYCLRVEFWAVAWSLKQLQNLADLQKVTGAMSNCFRVLKGMGSLHE